MWAEADTTRAVARPRIDEREGMVLRSAEGGDGEAGEGKGGKGMKSRFCVG